MDKALKQRLVGAIVLIALAVIVLPMILGGRPSSGGPGPGEIELPAEPPDLEFETRRFPVGDQPTPGSRQAAENLQAENEGESETGAQTEAEVTPTPPPVQTEITPDSSAAEDPAADVTSTETQPEVVEDAGQAEADEPVDTPAAIQTSPPDRDASLRYVVQVASFGSAQNATRLASQLEDAGYAVLLDHVSSETAQLNRVRVGPYASEAAAQTVARELRGRFSGVNPRIVDLQPEQASPAIASDDPLMRWIVQVGSFSSPENAKNLVSRLQASGLSAFDEAVTTDTSTIYRVRVGPFLDRDEALRIEQQISNDMGIDGVVMSSD